MRDYSEKDIVVILDNVVDCLNIGSIFRLADALGIKKIYIGGVSALNIKSVNKTSRSTHKSVPYELIPNTVELIHCLRNKEYNIIAAEITDESIDLSNLKKDIFEFKKTAIVFGNEQHGISQQVLDQCDFAVHIKMQGLNSSMNVAMAMGIICYQINLLLS